MAQTASITDKQRAYIESLLQRRYGSPHITSQVRRDHNLTQREARFQMTRSEASQLIDSLKEVAS